MKAIVVTDQAAGTAGMTLVERPEPRPSRAAWPATTRRRAGRAAEGWALAVVAQRGRCCPGTQRNRRLRRQSAAR